MALKMEGKTCTIQKPTVFGPTDREQKALQWRDWYWSVKQYLAVLDPLFLEDMVAIENHLDTEVNFELEDRMTKNRREAVSFTACWVPCYRESFWSL